MKINNYAKILIFVSIFVILASFAFADAESMLMWHDTDSSTYTITSPNQDLSFYAYAYYAGLQDGYPLSVILTIDSDSMPETFLTYEGTVLNNVVISSEQVLIDMDLDYLNLADSFYTIEFITIDSFGGISQPAYLYLNLSIQPQAANILNFVNDFNNVGLDINDNTNIDLYANTHYTNSYNTPLDISGLAYSIVNSDCDDVVDFSIQNGILTVSSDVVEDTCSFRVRIDDPDTIYTADPAFSNTIDVTVNDLNPNHAPVAYDVEATTTINTPVQIVLSCIDEDSDALNHIVLTQPTQGILSGSQNIRTYTPNEDFVGNDSFNYWCFDGQEYSNVANILIHVEDTTIPPNYLNFNPNINEVIMNGNSQFELSLWNNTMYYGPENNQLDKSTLDYSIVNAESCNDFASFAIEDDLLTIETFENADDCAFQIYVEETIWQGEQQTATSNIIDLNIQLDTLNLIEINCEYEVVPLEGTQICYALFANQDGLPVQDAEVSFFYLNQIGPAIGTCITDENGYCDLAFTVLDQVGDYDVYTSAYASGYEPFIDMNNIASFLVREKQYDIVEFNIYDDSANFGNPQMEITEFYRGEDMYVEFQVLDVDTNETVINPSLFSSVTLYGDPNLSPRAFVNFQFIELTTDGYYHFALDAIPLDDDYLGDSLVISYVLGQGEDVGQSERVVQIYNNVPVWGTIPNFVMEIGDAITLDLDDYTSDLEDDELTYIIDGFPSSFLNVVLENNILQIEALSSGVGPIELTVVDSDNGYSFTWFEVYVEAIIPELNAYFTAPSTVNPGQEFTLDASGSTGNIIEYCWDFDEGIGFCTLESVITYTYEDRGSYRVTLTVVDDEGNDDTLSKVITVKRAGSCSDGVDNDGDDLIDMDDPGCQESDGFTEFNLNTDLEKGLKFEYVDVYTNDYYVYPGEEVYINTKLRNKASDDIDNIRLIVMVPEFGIKIKSQQFDLNNGNTETVNMIIDVPYWTPAGEYAVKITATNGDIIRSTYRFIYVGN